MSSSSRKPVRRSPSRTAAAPVAPPIDVEPAAPVDPAEPVARYTWPEIRARVADADKASLATYRVAVAPTGSYFGRRTRASKAAAPAPADGGTVTPAKK